MLSFICEVGEPATQGWFPLQRRGYIYWVFSGSEKCWLKKITVKVRDKKNPFSGFLDLSLCSSTDMKKITLRDDSPCLLWWEWIRSYLHPMQEKRKKYWSRVPTSMIYILVFPLKKIYGSPSAVNQRTDFPAPSQTDALLYNMRESPQSVEDMKV